MTLPPDYLERVYAGVLGKIIGVYLGRPFEGWTYERIMTELGDIRGRRGGTLGDAPGQGDGDLQFLVVEPGELRLRPLQHCQVLGIPGQGGPDEGDVLLPR